MILQSLSIPFLHVECNAKMGDANTNEGKSDSALARISSRASGSYGVFTALSFSRVFSAEAVALWEWYPARPCRPQ